MALHIRNTELPGDDESRTFLGRDHGGVPVSFLIQTSPPGHGPGPHRHPYAEVFVLHEGSGSFLAGDETIRRTRAPVGDPTGALVQGWDPGEKQTSR